MAYTMDDVSQLQLFTGRLRCQACDDLVDELQRVRRFRICAACYAAVVPSAESNTPEFVQQNGEFWAWFNQMSLRYPTPARAPSRLAWLEVSAEAFIPTCACGAERPEVYVVPGQPRSLWGRQRMPRCVRCAGRLMIEAAVRVAEKIAPGRDDETWLDLLYQSDRALFDIGLLPDYWFQLRRQPEPRGGAS